MATPHGLAQDHTTLTVGGAALARLKQGRQWLHRKANKVLDNLMYFQAFDTTGTVILSGEICLKASASWSEPITMKCIKHMIGYGRTGGKNAAIAFTGTMTTLFDGTTPAALCYENSKVTIVLSKSKSYRQCALVDIITQNGSATIEPLKFEEVRA